MAEANIGTRRRRRSLSAQIQLLLPETTTSMIGLIDALPSVVVSGIRLIDGVLALALDTLLASATGMDEARDRLQRRAATEDLSRHSDENLLTQRVAIDAELRLRYRGRMMANVGAIDRQRSTIIYQDSIAVMGRRRNTG